MEKITTAFIVSDEPDSISRPVDDQHQDPPLYSSPEEAGEAIKTGEHGEFGTKYVLRVAFTPVAEYRRPWALVRKMTGDEDDGHA